jgi:short-subunit dehydrogenase
MRFVPKSELVLRILARGYHAVMKSVFITGASSGIGEAFAKLYANQGAVVGLVARREDLLEKLRASLPNPQLHKTYAVDVNDHEALARAAEDFIGSVGHVEIVIASAGISIPTPTEKPKDVAQFTRIFNTNVTATVATFAPFVAHMKLNAKKSPCRLVGIASVAGVRGFPGAAGYSASKAAIISYCESLRVELKGSGVKVVTLAPGYIRTPLTASMPDGIPFFMPVDQFAIAAATVIDRGVSYSVIPWQMGAVGKLLRLLPDWLYDVIMARARLIKTSG